MEKHLRSACQQVASWTSPWRDSLAERSKAPDSSSGGAIRVGSNPTAVILGPYVGSREEQTRFNEGWYRGAMAQR